MQEYYISSTGNICTTREEYLGFLERDDVLQCRETEEKMSEPPDELQEE